MDRLEVVDQGSIQIKKYGGVAHGKDEIRPAGCCGARKNLGGLWNLRLHQACGSPKLVLMETLSSLLPIIQLAITPVILISGMGALMITLTNRMARIVDRTRVVAEAIPSASAEDRSHLEDQLNIMWRRALLIRRAVTSNGLSMLVSCLLVVVLFATALFHLQMPALILGLFAAGILLLIASLVDFLRDIFVSLHALHLQVERARNRPSKTAPWPPLKN